MAEQDVTHTLVKLDGVTARQINQNFRDVQEFVNGQVVHADNTNSPIPIVGDRVWNTAWGQVAFAERTSSVTFSTTSAVQDTTLSVSFASLAGRRYRVMLTGTGRGDVGVDFGARLSLTDAVGTTFTRTEKDVRNTDDRWPFVLAYTYSGATGTTDWQVNGWCTVASRAWRIDAASQRPTQLIVEDVGPV